MYRIELRAGEEAIYKTFDEFAKAVRTGAVDGHARVWHTASAKWLPISFHPHFKRAQASKEPAPAAELPAAPPPKPKPAPKAPEPVAIAAPPAPPPTLAPAPAPAKTRELEFLELPPAPAPVRHRSVPGSLFAAEPQATPRHIEALVAAADTTPAVHLPTPAPTKLDDPSEILIDISRPRPRFLQPRVLGMVAGIGVIAAAVAFVVAHRPEAAPTAEEPAMASTSLAATPNTSFDTQAPAGAMLPDSTAAATAAQPVMYMAMPDIPKGPATDTTSNVQADGRSILPAAPRLGSVGDAASTTSDGHSPAMLAARYAAAHDGAEAALANRLRAAGISALFGESRLSAGQVSDTRLAVAGIANFIRSFRKQDAAIERAYRDSAAQFSAQWRDSDQTRWQALANRGETTTAAHSADQLLEDISSLLGVLEEQQGAYTVSGGTVTFRDAGATLRYGTLRRRVADRLDAGDSASAVSAALRQVIGKDRPPMERYTE